MSERISADSASAGENLQDLESTESMTRTESALEHTASMLFAAVLANPKQKNFTVVGEAE
ncbi:MULTISPECIES: hypothetical protein [Bacillus]|uniref:hypothetical protein n=1 Tax=Bacillus TaxID=1386 RepID=UPI00024588A4|nr:MULTISPECIES: hypothetical protein [Bacillus]AKF32364.1 hypothetical protein AAV29_18180 [Bacillus velezensis]AVX15759.1 hypothetical protein C5I45_02150 [Bacillus sp. ZY-1-1]MBR8692471.1 hypothetical protein [Bacillus velezensis]MCX2883118.1 hypothetical protein [Bacillus velezensis]MDF3256881.1 hypothetical protein [Bacillus velezensis]